MKWWSICCATLILLPPNLQVSHGAQSTEIQEGRYEGRTFSDWRGDLRDPSPELRRRAVEALGHLGPAAVPILIEALRDTDAEVRWWAVEVLSWIGPAAKDAVPALVQTLGDDDKVLRMKAAMTLSTIGPAAKDAVAALIKAMRDADRDVRMWSADALGLIAPTHKDGFVALTHALRDSDEGVRGIAASALRPSGSAAVPALIRAIEDPSPAVRQQVADALGAIGPAAKDGVAALMKSLGDDQSVVRAASARALGKIGPAAQEAVPSLIQILKDEDPKVWFASAQSLEAIGPASREAVPELTRSLSDPDVDVKKGAALALGTIESLSKDAITHLQNLLERNAEIRPWVKQALRQIKVRSELGGLADPDQAAFVFISPSVLDVWEIWEGHREDPLYKLEVFEEFLRRNPNSQYAARVEKVLEVKRREEERGKIEERRRWQEAEASAPSGQRIDEADIEQRQAGTNAPLIDALNDLKAALLAKVDSDVETTARAFWDAYDIQRSRRVADFVLAPLTVIEQAIGIVAAAKNAPEIIAGISRAENILQIVSVLMGLSQLGEVGENLQAALDGPTYSSLVQTMLREASTSSVPGDYAATVKLYLYGIGGRTSPVGVPHRLSGPAQPTSEMVWGAEAVKRRISDDIAKLIKEAATKAMGPDVQVEAFRAQLAALTNALKQSKMGNVTISSSVADPAEGSPTSLSLGSIGALEQVRQQALTNYENDLRLEQISVLTSAVKAGTQVISLKVGYKTPGGKLLKEVQRDVITPGAVLVNTLAKTYTTNARSQVNGLPHEMVLSLPGELANTWTLIEGAIASNRGLLKTTTIANGPGAKEQLASSSPETLMIEYFGLKEGLVKTFEETTIRGDSGADSSITTRLETRVLPKAMISDMKVIPVMATREREEPIIAYWVIDREGVLEYAIKYPHRSDAPIVTEGKSHGLRMPLQPGTTWDYVSGGGETYGSALIAGVEDVEVAAGTFRSCLKIQAEKIGGTLKVRKESVAWLCRGIGAVKSLYRSPAEKLEIRRDLISVAEMPKPVYAQSSPPDFLTNTTIDPETGVRFSLVKGHECNRDMSFRVTVIGELPQSTNLLDDALVKGILKKGAEHFLAQCPKYSERTKVVINVYLFNGPIGKPDKTFYGGPRIEGFGVWGAVGSDTRFQKLETYENLPLKELQADRRRKDEEENKRRAEEERRRREAEEAMLREERVKIPKIILQRYRISPFFEMDEYQMNALVRLKQKNGSYCYRPDDLKELERHFTLYVLAKDSIKGLIPECLTEEKKVQIAAARKYLEDFGKKHGIQDGVDCEVLNRNPFAFERKNIALKVTFEQMIARDQGLFGVGDALGGCGVVVSGIPQGAFSAQRVEVLLVGNVLGNTEVKIGMATLRVPHLKFVGVHICRDRKCSDLFPE